MITKEQYIQGIRKFGKIEGDFAGEETIAEYPYFLLCRMVSAVHGKSEDNTVLALMHPDRARLSAVLQKKTTVKKVKEVSKKELASEKKKTKEISKKESAVEKKKKESKEILQKKSHKIEEKKKEKGKSDPLKILKKRLQDIENEQNNPKNIAKNLPPLPEPELSVSLDELVEKFTHFPPSVTAIEADFKEENPQRDLGENSAMEKMDVVSETLAEIYASQKLFERAIKIYQELLLKYPKKNAIFASRIENLRENIEQDKKR